MKVMGQNADAPPIICIANYGADVVNVFLLLGSTIYESVCLGTEQSKRIGKPGSHH